jgi:mevalonate kinase
MHIIVSAPGKLMLMGEHSVVFDKACIVTAVNERMQTIVQKIDQKTLVLKAEDLNLFNYQKEISELGQKEVPKGARFVEFIVKNIFEKYNLENQNFGLTVETKSEFSSEFGFGSSSSVTVCVAKAISQLFNLNLSNQELFEICYQSVLQVQGKGSGFDIASGIWGGTILFQNKGQTIKPLEIPNLDLVVGYTGQKYETVKVLNEVEELKKEFPQIINKTYEDIDELVKQAIDIFKTKEKLEINKKENLEKFGKLMNFNQGYLEILGVGSLELSKIIYVARNSGAFGAKLSGSGKGDCAIALVDNEHKKFVENAIKKVGFEVINTKIGAQGACIEKT